MRRSFFLPCDSGITPPTKSETKKKRLLILKVSVIISSDNVKMQYPAEVI